MHTGFFVGRLGQDAEVKVTAGGQPYTKLSIAVDLGKDKEGEKRDAWWIRATIWGKRAEALAPHCKKGNMVAVTGQIELNTWTGNDNETHTDLQVNVDQFSFAGGSKKDGEAQQDKPAARATNAQLQEEDIPF